MLILLFVFSIIPIAASIVISFSNSSGVGCSSFIGLANYKELFTDIIFKKALGNTLFFVVVAVTINLVVSTTLAVAITSVVNKKLKNTLRGLFFMPAVVPIVALSYVWIMIFEPSSGVLNQILSVFGVPTPIYWLNDARLALPSVIFVTLWCDLGYNLVLIMAGLDAIPKMFYEAAHIDGANEMQVFFKITLPLLVRTMLFVSIMTCISYFQVFAQVQIMTGGRPDNASQVLAFAIYQNAFQYMRLGYASAMAVVLLVLILIVSVFQLVSVKIDWEY
jgi:multiple sugar transport system permease protein/raffinose/stachyose/melibiose transport system permease protein